MGPSGSMTVEGGYFDLEVANRSCGGSGKVCVCTVEVCLCLLVSAIHI